jgi:LPS sulfotransferase NodH
MTIRALLTSDELMQLYDVIVPKCEHSAGASAPDVTKRLTFIYEAYRPNEISKIISLLEVVHTGLWQEDPYFQTFAETVIEAYWTSETGLVAVGFTPAKTVTR